MEEIKFRAWDISFKRMKLTGMGINQGVLEGEDVIIMQYTGLKDKHGVEIYKSDIVKIIFEQVSLVREVKWGSYDDGEYVTNVECWMVGGLPLSDKGGLFGTEKHEYEVIGNIHENPELIQ